ncbi:TonB-linked outer membrane protein, SusC/RagA family [bacterium A37T11]|nr:TonB-linked outer membrane protein, SusC/RagA family [bacterium A37T11]
MKSKLKIILSFLMAVFSFGFIQAQEKRQVTGTVVNESTGAPLPSVTITVTGRSKASATTGKDGNFSIEVPQAGSSLVFSLVGYTSLTVPVSPGENTLAVKLHESNEVLNEIVVVGYGSQRKIETTGSIASVKAADLNQRPVANVAQGLQARVSGIQVSQNSGSPGGSVSVRIRGTNSINGTSEPLYIVDGIQISNSGGINDVSPLSTINPGDIQSVEILKDASATAIYGSRAANGVVLITTKRGASGVTRIEIESYFGTQSTSKKLDVLDASQFAQLENEIYKDNYYQDPASLSKGVNWQNIIFRNAPMNNQQLSIGGGNEKTQLSLSLNYFKQDGIIVNSDFNRYSYRLNVDHQVNDRFKIGSSIIGSYSVNNGINAGSQDLDNGSVVTGSVLGAAIGAPPTLEPYRPDGTLFPFAEQGNGRYREVANPLNFTEILQRAGIKRTLINVFGEYEIIPGLVYRASFNSDIQNQLNDNYSPIAIIAKSDINENSGSGSKNNQDFLNLLHESLLTYTRKFNEVHSLKLTGLFATQVQTYKQNVVSATGFPNDATLNEALQLALNRTVTSNRTKERLDSYMGRINYGYKDKLFLDLTGRVDGSSKFGANHKYGFFPAAAVAWRIKQEAFLSDVKAISDLKLRVSYGITGNAGAITPYQSLRLVSSNGGYNINNTYLTGIGPTGIANPDLRWERSKQADVGIDLGFFDNRVSLVADYYKKKTNDLLYVQALPLSSGYATMVGNFAAIENHGIELSANADILKGVFKWSVSANFTANKNKVLDLDGGVTNERFINTYSLLKVGEPLGVFKTYVFDGINQSADEIVPGYDGRVGGQKVKDLNNDDIINSDDQRITGDPNPKFIYGFSSNLSYKNFDLSLFLSGSYGNDIYNISRLSFENPLGQRNLFAGMVDRWTPENHNNQYASGFPGGRQPISDYSMEDGSYLRMRNITLGYRFTSFTKVLQSIRIYVSANNPFTITNYSGYDPEVNSFAGSNTAIGIDNLVYPQARSFIAGLQLNF